MTGYLGTLIAVGAVVAFSGFVSYAGESEKTVKSAIGVILLSALIFPILALLNSISTIDINGIFDTSFEDAAVEDSLYYKTAEENFALGVERLICEELGISFDDVLVYLSGFDMVSMRAEKITIILSGKAVYADYRRVVETIRAEGLGECEVKLEFSG